MQKHSGKYRIRILKLDASFLREIELMNVFSGVIDVSL
jgi:hypothetical protein